MGYNTLIWKSIKGFEGLYELRNDGLLHILPKPHRRVEYTYGGGIDGYLHTTLYKNNIQISKIMHRLVYETFVGSIPKGYDVHHKDHNKHNNFVYINENGSVDLEKSNLELILKKDHNKIHKSKPVLQYTKDGQFVAEYKSAMDASRKTGLNSSNIRHCCNGDYGVKTVGGFIWKYKEVA